MNTAAIIQEAISLPVEERARVIDSLLRSMNSPNEDLEKEWTEVAQRRLQELRSQERQSIPGEAVFERLWKRYE